MSEKSILLSELMNAFGKEMLELKTGLNQAYSMLNLIEQGSSNNSVEAIPVMVDVVRKNLKDSVGSKVFRMEEYLVKSICLIKDMEEADKKPKYPRRTRTAKPKTDAKPADKPVRKTNTKKVEPVEKKEETVVVAEETIE